MEKAKELTEFILARIPKIETDELSVKKAEAMSNAVGKAINLNKLQLEYMIAKQKTPEIGMIEFLDT